jgi:hypothetical protein
VPAELQPAAGALRTVVVPAHHFANLPGLAWSLSQHPRTRFIVVAHTVDGGAGPLASVLPGMPSVSSNDDCMTEQQAWQDG